MKIFLISLVVFLIASCELPSLIEADKYIEPIPIEVTENIPVVDNLWDRIRINAENKHGYLDAKTIEYINAYLRNPDQLDMLFEKGRYFLYFVIVQDYYFRTNRRCIFSYFCKVIQIYIDF